MSEIRNFKLIDGVLYEVIQAPILDCDHCDYDTDKCGFAYVDCPSEHNMLKKMGLLLLTAKKDNSLQMPQEILLSKFPNLPQNSNKIGMNLIIEAMKEYAEQLSDLTLYLIANPMQVLKPLEDMYREENPLPGDKFYLPDATEFYKWIVNKIIK